MFTEFSILLCIKSGLLMISLRNYPAFLLLKVLMDFLWLGGGGGSSRTSTLTTNLALNTHYQYR